MTVVVERNPGGVRVERFETDRRVVVTNQERVRVGRDNRGPRGVQGPIGPAGGDTVKATAAVALSGHRVVRSTPDGADYASCTEEDHAGTIIGVTVNAAQAGSSVDIAVVGEIEESSWAFNLGAVFLGVGGHLVQTPPPEAVFVRQIGTAVSPTKLLLASHPTIILT